MFEEDLIYYDIIDYSLGISKSINHFLIKISWYALETVVILMHKKCDYWNAELTSRSPHYRKNKLFPWVLKRFDIILEFLTLFRVPVNYGKYSYSKFQQFFSKCHFQEFKDLINLIKFRVSDLTQREIPG